MFGVEIQSIFEVLFCFFRLSLSFTGEPKIVVSGNRFGVDQDRFFENLSRFVSMYGALARAAPQLRQQPFLFRISVFTFFVGEAQMIKK